MMVRYNRIPICETRLNNDNNEIDTKKEETTMDDQDQEGAFGEQQEGKEGSLSDVTTTRTRALYPNTKWTKTRRIIVIAIIVALTVGVVITVAVVVSKNKQGTNMPYPVGLISVGNSTSSFCNQMHCWKSLGFSIQSDRLGDTFGSTVSLSADGNRFAVVSPITYESISPQGGGNGDQAKGYIRVYDIDTAATTVTDGPKSMIRQVGQTIGGDVMELCGDALLSKDGKTLAIISGIRNWHQLHRDVYFYALVVDKHESQWKPMRGSPLEGESRDVQVSLNYNASIVAIASLWPDTGRIPDDDHPVPQECRVQVYRRNVNGNHASWKFLGGKLSLLTNFTFSCKSELSHDGSVLAVTTNGIHIYRFSAVNQDWVGGHVPTALDKFAGETKCYFLSALSGMGTNFVVYAQSVGQGDLRSSPHIYRYTLREGTTWEMVNPPSGSNDIETTDGTGNITQDPNEFDYISNIAISASGNRVLEDRIVRENGVVHHALTIRDMPSSTSTWRSMGGVILSDKYDGHDLSSVDMDMDRDGRRIVIGQWGRDKLARVEVFECYTQTSNGFLPCDNMA